MSVFCVALGYIPKTIELKIEHILPAFTPFDPEKIAIIRTNKKRGLSNSFFVQFGNDNSAEAIQELEGRYLETSEGKFGPMFFNPSKKTAVIVGNNDQYEWQRPNSNSREKIRSPDIASESGSSISKSQATAATPLTWPLSPNSIAQEADIFLRKLLGNSPKPMQLGQLVPAVQIEQPPASVVSPPLLPMPTPSALPQPIPLQPGPLSADNHESASSDVPTDPRRKRARRQPQDSKEMEQGPLPKDQPNYSSFSSSYAPLPSLASASLASYASSSSSSSLFSRVPSTSLFRAPTKTSFDQPPAEPLAVLVESEKNKESSVVPKIGGSLRRRPLSTFE